ncbi:unnamed protein product [Polarella glacialis]|uniref:Uncharacterized protein n=2 Tax=Polarella glacialis TaxID=89957 RepID=A0A813L9J2_POLGL|nr:unnamed protein product [Polarella glacialis]
MGATLRRPVLCAAAFLKGPPAAESISSQFVHLLPEAASWSGPSDLRHKATVEFAHGMQAWNQRSPLEGLQLFLRSAQKGYEVGEYLFRSGLYQELPPSDYQQAIRWYKRGARMNHPACTTMLGKLHLAMGELVEAVKMLSRTAAPIGRLPSPDAPQTRRVEVDNRGLGGEAGDALPQWFLGELHFQTEKIRDAVRWWKRSADNGDVDAMMRLSQVLAWLT